jgi:hypothetical protein
MKIAFFTESNFTGKVPRNHPNMRTEMAWMASLQATHYPITSLNSIQESFDLGIIIVPKKNIDVISQIDIIGGMKNCCKTISFMQEGPCDYWEDYPLQHQIWFYNILMEMDFLFCHNDDDMKYFNGLTGKQCLWMPSLMIEDNIRTQQKTDKAIIGGNMCKWYSGMISYICAQEFGVPVYAPSMGRKIEGEEQLDNLNHLPYMNWNDWITVLSSFKYGVHLMKTHAAGTFALNAAYCGIPCIGYHGLMTQSECHPFTTVYNNRVNDAVNIAKKLKNDKKFYDDMSALAKEKYETCFSEKVFLKTFKEYGII